LGADRGPLRRSPPASPPVPARNAKGELELAFLWCYSPLVTLAELVAGARWAVEDGFAEAKNETGLDHYRVRLHGARYRQITLSMLAC
jgi:SRSO17 transposase